MDFTSKTVAKDKERYLIVTRESIHQEDITIINMYTPNNRASKCKKQPVAELKGETVYDNSWKHRQHIFNNG